jgi:hypothetical protein
MSHADDTYETARKLLLFYNAECNYENAKKGFYSYLLKYNSLMLLAPTPDYLKDKNLAKEYYGNKAYGTQPSAPIKNLYRRMIRDYLLKPYEITTTDDEGNEIQTTIPNLRRITYRGLLKELAS